MLAPSSWIKLNELHTPSVQCKLVDWLAEFNVPGSLADRGKGKHWWWQPYTPLFLGLRYEQAPLVLILAEEWVQYSVQQTPKPVAP